MIVPVYKVEPYIHRCINSILAQTFKDFELILIDDGSPDNCPKICDEYARNDNRISVIHQNNAGLSAARNAGLNVATGDYIAFVDSDDYIHPLMYGYMIEQIELHNTDIAICDFIIEKQPIKINHITIPVNIQPLLFNFESAMTQMYTVYNGPNNPFVVVMNKLYKAYIFKELRFLEGHRHEDEYILHYIFYVANQSLLIRIPFYCYIQREHSIMSDNARSTDFDDVYAFEDRMIFFHSDPIRL